MVLFGAFDVFDAPFTSRTMPNGAGKTTQVNAWVFALTGRTLNGFQPRRIDPQTGMDTAPEVNTSVTIKGWPTDGTTIRRVLTPKGSTQLYLCGNVVTQTEFADILAQQFGIPIDLVAACADANLLTDPALTAEQLRRLLVRASLVEDDEATSLRRERDALRRDRKAAEQYALTVCTVPPRTVEPLTEAEREYLDTFNGYLSTAGLSEGAGRCPMCGRPYDAAETARRQREHKEAKEKVRTMSVEAQRIREKQGAYDAETAAIEEAEAIIARASGARRRVQEIDRQIAALEEQIRAADAAAVRPALPDDVQIITSTTAKTTGRTSSTCTLTYKGVPLKSINRAKRVEICVRMLETARVMTGTVDKIPIIIDNAESVQGLDDVWNVIRFTVGE